VKDSDSHLPNKKKQTHTHTRKKERDTNQHDHSSNYAFECLQLPQQGKQQKAKMDAGSIMKRKWERNN